MGEDMGRSIFPIALLVAGILSGCFFAGPTRVASIGAGGQTQHTEANEYPYYVEFRVAVSTVYTVIATLLMAALTALASLRAQPTPTSIRLAISWVWCSDISFR